MSPGRTASEIAVADGDQQRVAGGVAEAVVDLLEAVEVDEEQGDGAVAPRGRRSRATASRSSSTLAGRQAGEGVVVGPLAQRLGGLLLHGDVAAVGDEAAARRGRRAGSSTVASTTTHRPVGGDEAVPHRPVHARVRHGAAELGADGGAGRRCGWRSRASVPSASSGDTPTRAATAGLA